MSVYSNQMITWFDIDIVAIGYPLCFKAKAMALNDGQATGLNFQSTVFGKGYKSNIIT